MRRGLLGLGTVFLAAGAWHLARVNSRLPDDRVLDADEVRRRYDEVAGSYELANSFYELIGARRLARRGMAELGLQAGDTAATAERPPRPSPSLCAAWTRRMFRPRGCRAGRSP